jgi:MFS family permease
VSLVGVILAIHLADRRLPATAIGVIIGIGMTSNAAATVVAALRADSWGRRRTLVGLGLISAAGYLLLAVVSDFRLLLAVAAGTMLNGMGRDRGPASAIEQALLPSTTADAERTWTMAWYNAAVDTGHAVGALGAALPTVIAATFHVGVATGHSWTFFLCGMALVAAAVPYARLSRAVECAGTIAGPVEGRRIAESDRRVVRKLAALFALDSVGGGFLNSALIAYWFVERYGASEVQLAGLFFAARLLNVFSHFAAASIARRIGLLKTMVATHLPSSVFLMLAPAAPSGVVAGVLFLAREALVEMDVPTRQSYVMAIVPPSARTYASGVTNVTRNAGWALGPFLGGAVMQHVMLAGPLFVGGTLKILYDVTLYRSFRHLHPPEERERALST